VVPVVADGSPNESNDCARPGTGIAARTAVVKTSKIARWISAPGRIWLARPASLLAGPARPFSKKCDSAIQVDDFTVFPPIGIAPPSSKHAPPANY
jgi:hypothetical protein